MFFLEKITQIREGDKVLEIGPGSTPYFRSDVFLELIWGNEDEAISQRGGISEKFITEKKTIYYDGNRFPFEDKEFDYIICSHVIEHVKNIEDFIFECFRVGKKGYFEYPTIYFEYIYNISVHLNIQKFNNVDNCLYYTTKKETYIEHFKHIQFFINEGMNKGYLPDLYNYISKYSIEGFEWDQEFQVIKTENIEKLLNKELSSIPINIKQEIIVEKLKINKNLFQQLKNKLIKIFK